MSPQHSALLLVLLFSTSNLAAAAATPVLVADFNPGQIEDPLAPENIAAIDGLVYFSGDDGPTGREPWVSDGTPAGTRLLADLCLGPCGIMPYGFAKLGGAIVFLGRADGTTTIYRLAGGVVSAITSLEGQGNEASALGGALYFVLAGGGNAVLWKTDGSADGTQQVALLCSGPFCGIAPLRLVGDGLFFEIFSLTSITNSLKRIAPSGAVEDLATFDIYRGGSSNLSSLDAAQVVFKVNFFNSQFGEVWKFDRVSGTTAPIDPVSPTSPTVDIESFFVTWRGRPCCCSRGAAAREVPASSQPAVREVPIAR